MVANMKSKTAGGYPERGSLGEKGKPRGCEVPSAPACRAARAAVPRMVNAIPWAGSREEASGPPRACHGCHGVALFWSLFSHFSENTTTASTDAAVCTCRSDAVGDQRQRRLSRELGFPLIGLCGQD